MDVDSGKFMFAICDETLSPVGKRVAIETTGIDVGVVVLWATYESQGKV